MDKEAKKLVGAEDFVNKITLLKKPIPTQKRGKLSSSKSMYRVVRYLRRKDREHWVVVHLNCAMEIVGRETIAVGTLTNMATTVREVFKGAFLNNSFVVGIAHNHPSGSSAPSELDRNMAQQLISVSKILGIPLVDFIVVGDGDYYSMNDNRDCDGFYGEDEEEEGV